MSQYAPIDVHAHYFPQDFLELIAKHGPSHGFEYKMVEGKGPQFKHGHLLTGPVGPKFVDLGARLEASARPTTTRSRRRTSGIRSGSSGSRRCRCTSPRSR